MRCALKANRDKAFHWRKAIYVSKMNIENVFCELTGLDKIYLEYNLIDYYFKYDYYDIKGILDEVAFKFNVPMRFEPSNENFMHPYQQAKIFIGGKESGLVGKIHPSIAESFDISEDSFKV